jgi:hypothetical protein
VPRARPLDLDPSSLERIERSRRYWPVSAIGRAAQEGAFRQRAIQSLKEKLFSRDDGTVCGGSGKSEYCRMFKEMNFLSAHQSSNPICPAMESVSAVGLSRLRARRSMPPDGMIDTISATSITVTATATSSANRACVVANGGRC